MPEEFKSPEGRSREARIAWLLSRPTVGPSDSFPNKTKVGVNHKKKTRTRPGETSTRDSKSPRLPEPLSSASSRRNGKNTGASSSTGLDEQTPRTKADDSVVTRTRYQPPNMSPDMDDEVKNNEATMHSADNSAQVVTSDARKRDSQRRTSTSTSSAYTTTSHRYSTRSIPDSNDASIMEVEAIPSHVAKGAVSSTSTSSTSSTDDEELGIANSSPIMPREASDRDYPSVWIRLPNTSFGIAVGLAGQAIMWKIANKVDFLSTVINTQLLNACFWIASLTVGVLFLTAYTLKAWFYFPLVRDEYKDASRIHFFNMPHIIMMMLTASVPEGSSMMDMMNKSHAGEQIVWSIGFIIQAFFTKHIYERWLFSDTHNISCARPQFILSVIGWLTLASLGAQAEIEESWGLALPTWCFGFGMMLYIMVAISVFNGLHDTPKAKGSPALFLLIGPPAVGIVAWDVITDGGPGNFADMSALLLGWCLGLFMLLINLSPKIFQPPPSLGAYWAYVFPMSALASGLIRYAWAVQTASAEIVAVVFVALSMSVLLVVFIRMTIHIYQVWAGDSQWGDPLLSTERLASVSAITYIEMIPTIETA